MEYAKANRRMRRVPFLLFRYLNTERSDIPALRERYAVRFQYDLSLFKSELPDIDEFDIGNGIEQMLLDQQLKANEAVLHRTRARSTLFSILII